MDRTTRFVLEKPAKGDSAATNRQKTFEYTVLQDVTVRSDQDRSNRQHRDDHRTEDFVTTGTPVGVGQLHDGDDVHAEIDGVGSRLLCRGTRTALLGAGSVI